MAEFKKFMFDNFVIEEHEEKVEEAVEVAEPSVPDNVPEPEPEVEEIQEAVYEEVVEPEPEPEPVKTYTEEELAEQVQIAEHNGYEKGFKSSQSGIDEAVANVLNEINSRLLQLITEEETQKSEMEKQSLDLVLSIVRKLVPSLLSDEAKNIVNKFIADNFNNFKNESKLSFYIHPDIISYVQENIAKLANRHDFEGKIALHKDNSLGVSDCRIEWENGGVERNTGHLTDKIKAMLKEEQN